MTGYRLDEFGIEPRDWSGLWGVLAAPLLHGSWAHFLVQPRAARRPRHASSRSGGIRQFVAVTVLVWLVSGIGVWLDRAGGHDHGRRVRPGVRLAGLPDRARHLLPVLAADRRRRPLPGPLGRPVLDGHRLGRRRGHHRRGHRLLAGAPVRRARRRCSPPSWSADAGRRPAIAADRGGHGARPTSNRRRVPLISTCTAALSIAAARRNAPGRTCARGARRRYRQRRERRTDRHLRFGRRRTHRRPGDHRPVARRTGALRRGHRERAVRAADRSPRCAGTRSRSPTGWSTAG